MIIVTGGAGFIGSNILKGLEDVGKKDIVVVDWLGEEDKWMNLAKRELSHIVFPEQMDDFLAKHAQDIEAVIHMGAISTTTERDVDLITRSNVQLSWTLWEFCRDHQKQYIYASSAATYGSGSKGFDDHEDLEFLNNLRPLNAYGWSKAFFDRKVARELKEGRGTPPQYVGLKFFNVYGPNEYHKGGQKSVVAGIYPTVAKNEEVRLFKSYNPNYADGQQLRDFVWVGDIIDVVLWFLDNPKVSGLYNVGSGEARPFYDLAKATWDAAGKEPKIGYRDMPDELQGKYQYYTKANLEKLRAAGYTKEMTSLEEGIRQYVQDYLMKEDPYL